MDANTARKAAQRQIEALKLERDTKQENIIKGIEDRELARELYNMIGAKYEIEIEKYSHIESFLFEQILSGIGKEKDNA